MSEYTVADFLSEVGTNEASREKTSLKFDEVHSLNIEGYDFGTHEEYGDFITLTTEENIMFFSNYEMHSLKRVIGENEAPFKLHILRQKKQSTKSDYQYNQLTAKLEAIEPATEVVG